MNPEPYRASGRVDWPNFLPLAAVAIGAAIAGSGLLFVLYYSGMYFVVVMPLMVSMAVVQAVRMPILWGLCRSWLLGILLAVAMASVMFVGQFYWHFLTAYGLEHAHRIDHMPAFVQWRMENDVVMDNGRAQQPSFVGNVMLTSFDAFVIFGVTIGACHKWLKRPYSESTQQWMSSETLPLAAGEAARLKESVLAGETVLLGEIAPLSVAANPPFSEFTFYYVVNEQGQLADRMVLVACEMRYAKTQARCILNPTPIPPTVLTDEQSAMALTRLPSLQAKVRPFPLAAIEPAPAGQSYGKVVDAACPWWTTFREPPVLTKEVFRWFASLFIACCGIAAISLLVGLWAVTRPEEERSMWVATPCLGLMFASLTIGGWWVMPWQVSCIARLLRDRVRERPDRTIDPDGLDYFLVEFTPRILWKDWHLTDAEDHGYVRIDPRSRCLLYEGDRFRWRIAGSQIVKCEIEMKNREAHLANPQHHDPSYVVVLEIRTGDETRELPLRPIDWSFEVKFPKESYPRMERLAAVIGTIQDAKEVVPSTNTPVW